MLFSLSGVGSFSSSGGDPEASFHLAPLDTAEQQLYSKLLPNSRASHPISKPEPTPPTEEANFRRLYSRSCSFGHYQKLVTIDEGRNKDRQVSRELRFWLSSLFTTTDRCSVCITADVAPIPLWWTRPWRTWTPQLGARSSPWTRKGNPPFSSHGLRFGGAGSHLGCFTLSCESFQQELEVTDWWSQLDHIICKEQRPDPEVTKPDRLNTVAAPRNSFHKSYEQNQWQRAVLEESNLLLAMQPNSDTGHTGCIRGPYSP